MKPVEQKLKVILVVLVLILSPCHYCWFFTVLTLQEAKLCDNCSAVVSAGMSETPVSV